MEGGELQGNKTEMNKMKKGFRIVSITRKKHGRFGNGIWLVPISVLGRSLPIILEDPHKNHHGFHLAQLKILIFEVNCLSQSEMVSMLAGYWYCNDARD